MSEGPLAEALLSLKQSNMFISNLITSPNYILNGTKQAEYHREYEVEKITKPHSKGYYYTLSVSDTDDVFFQVFNGSKIAYWLHKLTGKEPINTVQVGNVHNSWGTVRKRTHLPATLGAAHTTIDEAVEAHKEALAHDDYVAGLLQTDPDNLKMIEGLEKLQEGEPETDQPPMPAYGFQGNVNTGLYTTTSNSASFYLTTSAANAIPTVQCEGDMEISGDLTINGQTFEDKISTAITKSLSEKTDEMTMGLLKTGELKESTGPKAQ
jgi:hypothetical protein